MERLITRIDPIPGNTQHVHRVTLGEKSGNVVSVAVVAVWSGAVVTVEYFN